MNIFDIIGPVMIGPSSSHTAGAVRLGTGGQQTAPERAQGHPDRTVRFLCQDLQGSWHRQGPAGRDPGLPQLFGRNPQHLLHCRQKGIHYTYIPTDIPNTHPNTARIQVTCEDGSQHTVQGASIGGGNIRVDYVDGMKVDFTGERNTILVPHYDRPGVIAAVTNIMWQKHKDVNIANFKLSRPVKGGIAMMTIEIDGMPPADVIETIRSVQYVTNVVLIRAI